MRVPKQPGGDVAEEGDDGCHVKELEPEIH
jgi:hypothetical protein